MAIIFIILRIIGLILAILVGMLLLLAILTLTVPVRYLFDFKCIPADNGMSAGGMEPASAAESGWYGKIRLTWFLRMIYLTLEYKEGDLDVRFRLLGIRLFSNKDKVSGKRDGDGVRREKKGMKDEPINASGEPTQGEPTQSKESEKKMGKRIEDELERKESQPSTNSIGSDDMENEKMEPLAGKRKKKNKCKEFWTSLRMGLIRIRKKWKGLLKTWKGIKDRLSWFRIFLTGKENKEVFKTIKREIVRFLKHAKPKTFRAKIKFGLGDPCDTGLALGALSLIYAYLGGGFQVEPDFENTVLEGFLYAKGRIRFLVVLGIVIRFYRDTGVRRAIREIRKQLA